MAASTYHQKGQAIVEYAVLLILIILIVTVSYSIGKPLICQITTENEIPLCPATSESPQTASLDMVTLMPIGLPVTLSLIVSLYDGTIRIKKGIINFKPGQLPANICLSCLTFDTWGLMTVLQKGSFSGSANLGAGLIFLFLMHLGFQALCLRIISDHRWRYIQLLLVCVSILFPVMLLISPNVF